MISVSLTTQDVIWTSIQHLLKVMSVKWTSKQHCMLTKTILTRRYLDVDSKSDERQNNIVCLGCVKHNLNYCREIEITLKKWNLFKKDMG